MQWTSYNSQENCTSMSSVARPDRRLPREIPVSGYSFGCHVAHGFLANNIHCCFSYFHPTELISKFSVGAYKKLVNLQKCFQNATPQVAHYVQRLHFSGQTCWNLYQFSLVLDISLVQVTPIYQQTSWVLFTHRRNWMNLHIFWTVDKSSCRR